MKKITLIPLGIAALGVMLSILVLLYPLSFGVPQDSISLATFLPSIFTMGVGAAYFVIQSQVTQNKEVDEKRKNHFNKINSDVLNLWLSSEVSRNLFFTPYDTISFLTVNIVKALETPPRFRQLMAHLEHPSYQHLKQLFDDIKRRESAQNESVGKFIQNIESRINTAIYAKGGDCEISPAILRQWDDTHPKNHYFLKEIIDNFFEAARDHDKDFVVKDMQHGYVRLSSGEGGRVVADSDNKESLECLRRKLNQIKPAVVKELAQLDKEAVSINTLFDIDFKTEVKALIIEIEDNQKMKGGCGLDFCPIKK